eukprot:3544485-Rhodomonas_salina.1
MSLPVVGSSAGSSSRGTRVQPEPSVRVLREAMCVMSESVVAARDQDVVASVSWFSAGQCKREKTLSQSIALAIQPSLLSARKLTSALPFITPAMKR